MKALRDSALRLRLTAPYNTVYLGSPIYQSCMTGQRAPGRYSQSRSQQPGLAVVPHSISKPILPETAPPRSAQTDKLNPPYDRSKLLTSALLYTCCNNHRKIHDLSQKSELRRSRQQHLGSVKSSGRSHCTREIGS